MNCELDGSAAFKHHACMMMRVFSVMAVAAMFLGSTGCVRTVDDRHRMANPFVRDKIEGRYEFPVDKVMHAAKDVLQLNGQLTGENTIINTVEGIIDTRRVWIRVDPVGDRWTRATVQVRTKGGGADIYLASEIDKQIALRLVTDKTVPPFVPAPDQTSGRAPAKR